MEPPLLNTGDSNYYKILYFISLFEQLREKHFMKCVRIWSFSGPNAGKHGPEKLRIRTLFTQWNK